MNNKQITFLEQFEEEMRTSANDAFLIKSKYKNGSELLTLHDMSMEKYIDLVELGDTDGLWEKCDQHLQNISC